MARFRCGLALVGALILVLTGCSSDTKPLDLPKAEREIRQLALKVYDAEAKVGPVRCPSEVPIKKGLTVFCTVEIDGAPLKINLHQTDDRGNVRIDQGQAVIFTKKMEAFVASYATKHGTPTSAVSCGHSTVLTRAPGKEVSCTVTFADGTTGVAKLVVRDTTGKVGLISIKPTKS